MIEFKKIIAFVLLTFTLINLIFTPSALTADMVEGKKIFSIHCAGCHINGSNILRRDKNLKQKALKKYGMNSVDAIASLVTNGKNNMSAFKERLTTEQIQDVANYVLEQAAKNWR